VVKNVERTMAVLLVVSALAACGRAKAPSPAAAQAASASADAAALGELRRAVEEGRRDDADAIAKRLSEGARKSKAGRVLLGRLAEIHGAGTEAKEAYQAVLTETPGHLEASLALGARLLEEGDLRGAITATDASLAVNPNDASLLLNRAYIVLAGDGFPKAVEAFEVAERASGGAAMVRLSYANALAKAERGADAVPVLVRVATDPGSSIGEVAEAGHELRQQGAFVQAFAAFDRVLAAKETGEVRVERALCKIGLRDAEGAMKELDAGLKIEPGYAPLHFYKAGRFAEARRWREARAGYDRYLELAPEGPLADLAKKRIRMVNVHLEK
jgi:tetratricopeptide (TPR) repeat protein